MAVALKVCVPGAMVRFAGVMGVIVTVAVTVKLVLAVAAV
jgi:hypothetical protein